MTAKNPPKGAGFRLQTAAGGIFSIGRDADENRVAVSPEGEVYVGSLKKPFLARALNGDALLVLESGFLAKVCTNGNLRIFSGPDSISIRPAGGVTVFSEEDEENAVSLLDDLNLMASAFLKGDATFFGADIANFPAGSLRLATTRTGATQISQNRCPITVTSRRDGATFVGSKRQPVLGRMRNGDIVGIIEKGFAVRFLATGEIVVVTAEDAVQLSPGDDVTLSSRGQELLFNNFWDEVEKLGREINDPVELPAPLKPLLLSPEAMIVQDLVPARAPAVLAADAWFDDVPTEVLENENQSAQAWYDGDNTTTPNRDEAFVPDDVAHGNVATAAEDVAAWEGREDPLPIEAHNLPDSDGHGAFDVDAAFDNEGLATVKPSDTRGTETDRSISLDDIADGNWASGLIQSPIPADQVDVVNVDRETTHGLKRAAAAIAAARALQAVMHEGERLEVEPGNGPPGQPPEAPGERLAPKSGAVGMLKGKEKITDFPKDIFSGI
ncbi:hypothetical protein ACEUZ9_001111 [Paracoccus litorisediminis]|uniref:hypothetical protein n=1 Tax=Paracoccus litorisediminis TaxID=2006130 RepID=UPI0037320009